jgi:hypothetical protein
VAGSGDKVLAAAAGRTLAWAAVSRQDAGRYVCEADNGYGAVPVSREVELEVLCEFYGPSSLLTARLVIV